MTHTAEILSVGTELLLGNIANTDAQDVSVALSELGIDVRWHTVVGDNPERVKQAVAVARTRADILIATGGLGPTYDDLTKQTLAEAFGKKLVFHEPSARKIRELYFQRLKTEELPDHALLQAWLPEGCTVFENSCGTAPGCGFEAGGMHVLMLPGPPSECRAMLRTGAVPYLKSLSDSVLVSRNFRIFGIGESSCEQLLRDVMESSENPTLAPYAKEGEVLLRLTAKAGSKEEAGAMMAPLENHVREILGDLIYGVDVDSLEQVVSGLLKERGQTLASAESCTGGLIAKRMTDLPGSSAVFLGGAVTYSTPSKHRVLGVDETLLREKGAVSPETAAAMAEGARALYGADYALSTTGVAGPDSDERGNPVGLVYVALASGRGTVVREFRCGSVRARCRSIAVNHALDMLRRELLGLSQPE
ncbi:MAG: competence/damage-inducible protein A [Oscillospiraceae bacterium]|nr:competence/damage-inducible protein A [Oscillospiraceae bacterium]